MADLTLHLVRHGETLYNAERRIQGQMSEGAPLSPRGEQQALELAEQLSTCTAQALYSSDLQRAMQTARAIAERLGLDVIPEPALRERHFGVLQGQLYSDVEAFMKEWWTRPDENHEGGESNRMMFARVGGFLDRLRADPPCDEIILVCHGGTVNMALAHLAGEQVETFTWRRLENCSVTTVTVPRIEVPSRH
jgi:probable phosphoglycerate mutase